MPSELQMQYPLSPRKFWKKMLGRIWGCFITSVVFGMFASGATLIGSGALGVRMDEIAFLGFWAIWFVALFVIFLGVNAWYIGAYIRRYYYDADAQFLTIKKGVFAPTEIHVQYQKIQDVYVDQDLVDRVFGLYDVHIASATVSSGIEAHIDGVEYAAAEGLKHLLLGKITGQVQANAVASSEATSAPSAGVASEPVVVPENISSETYPIATGRWIWGMLLSSFVSSLFISFFLTFWISVEFFGEAGVIGSIVLFFVVAIAWFFFSVVGSLLWKATFSWKFAPNYFQVNSGVISRSETHVPYGTIQDVILQQGIFERLLGLCTVRIENAVASGSAKTNMGGIRLPGQPLEKGKELVEIIRNVAHRKTQNTGL